MASTSTIPYAIRPFEATDEDAVLSLLRSALGAGPLGRRTAEFFRWKHLENPFGRSLMLVADADDQIIGLRAFMRWSFRAAGQEIRAVRAVDTATHPDHQGRGIFSRLTSEAVNLLRADTDLVFNTPNEKSLPGYLKLGWRIVGRAPVQLRIKHPARVIRNLKSVRHGTEDHPAVADQVGTHDISGILRYPQIAGLLATTDLERRLTTSRSAEFLDWRYGSSSMLNYTIELEHEGHDLPAIAVTRSRTRGRLRETSVTELLITPELPRAGTNLLRRIAHAAGSDHVSCSFARSTLQRRSAGRAGFIPIPIGPVLVALPLRPLSIDPFDRGSWSLSLGDLELF